MTRSSSNEIRLREVDDEDLPIFFEQQQDVEATRMAAFPPRDRDSFAAHWSKIRRDPAVTIRTILADGQVAGNIVQFEQLGIPLIGYWLGRRYWGRGIATRALDAFMLEVRSRPLYALVAARNLGSIRVLEKCGFVRENDPPGSDDEETGELLFKLSQ
jgi:RimJ/RimL family protein N-acetyltransferase